MKSQITFDRLLTNDESDLVTKLGWRSCLALGIPVTITSQDCLEDDGERKTVKIEPINHADHFGFEERVAEELHHLMYHAGPEIINLVQVECGYESWREEDRRRMLHQRFQLPNWKPVSFNGRKGQYVGRTIRDIPIVILPDGGEPVLRPRWPETNRLAQGGDATSFLIATPPKPRDLS
jgi:hypothetical protein